MPHPQAAEEDVAFFRAHGRLIVRNAVDPGDIARVAALCDEILENPETLAFDWAWEKDTPREARAVACPLSLVDVTFHHGRTPHMTPANVTGEWRRALAQHLYPPGCAGEGDHYPWKIYVNQFNGRVTVPETR